MSELIDVSRLCEDDMINISAQSRREIKRNKLMNILSIDIDEEENMREGICVDFCLDCIIFASNQGFQWRKVLGTVKFCMELLKNTATQGLQLEDATCVLRRSLGQLLLELDVDETKKLIDFLVNTFFQHYQLYLYCMTSEQDIDLTTLHHQIELPSKLNDLSTGVSPETWQFQQKIKDLEENKNKSHLERAEYFQTAVTKIQEEKSEAEKKLELACQLSAGDDLQKVLQNITKLEVSHVETEIKNSVNESKENVEYSFKRGLLDKTDTVKSRPLSKNRPRSKNKNKLAPS